MAVVPSLLLIQLFLRLDRARPEPKGAVLRAFMLGIVSTVPAFLLEFSTDLFLRPWFINPIAFAVVEAFIVAALCEEWIKLMVVRRFIYRSSRFDEVMDGIIYTVAAGLGFAAMENVIFVASGGMTVALLRAFTAVPLHTICSALLGYSIGKARFAATRGAEDRYILGGLMTAVLIHGLYDFLLFVVPYWGVVPGLLIFPLMLAAALAVVHRVRQARLEDRMAGRI